MGTLWTQTLISRAFLYIFLRVPSKGSPKKQVLICVSCILKKTCKPITHTLQEHHTVQFPTPLLLSISTKWNGCNINSRLALVTADPVARCEKYAASTRSPSVTAVVLKAICHQQWELIPKRCHWRQSIARARPYKKNKNWGYVNGVFQNTLYPKLLILSLKHKTTQQ
jgi:hypothetical protein